MQENPYPMDAKLPVKRQEESDLGFGSVVSAESRQRLLNQNGTFNVKRAGLSFLSSLNLYHTMIAMSWKIFLSLVLLLYFLSNLFFGSLYALLGAEALADSSSAPMENLLTRGFFFSVQTFATIGYGTLHPVGFVANILVTIESYYSMIATALITGIVFARFARPTARMIFSKVAVVAPYREKQGLMFRLVNGRSNQLLEVKVRVLLARFLEENGKSVRRFEPLELERDQVDFLPLAWTIVHPIDENSPLYNLTNSDLEKMDAEILVLLSATDETFASVVHTRSSYKPNEVKFGYKFVNLYNKMENNEPISIDIKKLSSAEPAKLNTSN